MNDSATDFIRQHPEYFESRGSYMVLRQDLRPLMEKYARAIDNEEFDRLRKQVATIHHQERMELQHELDDLRIQHQEATERIQHLRKNLHELDQEVARYTAFRSPHRGNQSSLPPGWLRSPTFCLTLDIFGLILLYIGLIMGKSISLSSTILGIACIGLGFSFYEQPQADRALPPEEPELMSDSERENVDKITRIRRTTLAEELRNEQKRQRMLNSQIMAHENSVNQLNA